MDTLERKLSIVLVEDNEVLRGLLIQALEEAGHKATALSCAEELEELTGGHKVDLFLIDLNLPGEDGLSLAKRVRATYPMAGLIMVTARSTLQDKVDGYACGADMYLTKPIEVPELCGAIAAFGRRQKSTHDLLSNSQGFILKAQELTLSRSGQIPVELSAAEAAMLISLARAPSQRAAYWQIAQSLGLNLETYAKASLEVRVVRLRKKLIDAGAPPNCIASIRSVGYQLCMPLQVL